MGPNACPTRSRTAFGQNSNVHIDWVDAVMAETNTIKITCSCGKSFRAPASAAGKRTRCPACGGTLAITPAGAGMSGRSTVPVATTAVRRTGAVGAPVRPAAAAVATADPLDALEELARQEEAATPIQDTPRCSQCMSPMANGAVICTNCGFDVRTGKKLAVATAAAPPTRPALANKIAGKSKAGVDRMAPQGSFVAGLVVSLVFAVLASSVWIGLAYATGYSIGYVAILIGGAAGVGMQLGHKGYSRAGGIAAAALTLVAILLAKLIVLELILARAHPARTLASIDSAKLGWYFFSPIGLIIMLIGMGAAFRTANGSVRD